VNATMLLVLHLFQPQSRKTKLLNPFAWFGLQLMTAYALNGTNKSWKMLNFKLNDGT
jgi:hypothetical protein